MLENRIYFPNEIFQFYNSNSSQSMCSSEWSPSTAFTSHILEPINVYSTWDNCIADEIWDSEIETVVMGISIETQPCYGLHVAKPFGKTGQR